jgi:stigma-specific protein Stig1
VSWRRGLVLLGAAWTALSVALSCGSDGLVGGSCTAGLDACGRRCVNLGSNPDHCGSCDNHCTSDEQCLAGVCLRANVPLDYDGGGADSGGNGGVLLPDGAVLLPDGAIISGGAGGTGSGGTGDGPGCTPPYDNAQNCGACGAACPTGTPFCEQSVPGVFECVFRCGSGLTACDERCVDLTNNAGHCGECDNRCASSICRNSQCVGAVANHVVLMCTDLHSGRRDSPQTLMLTNSVLLSNANPLRVLGYTRYTPFDTVRGVQRALNWADLATSRTIEVSESDSETDVRDLLNRDNFDVFIVYDQPDAPAGALAAAGTTLRDALFDFNAAGGVVIVLASAEGTGEMHQLITEAGLLAVNGLTPITDSDVFNRAPSDAVGATVLNQFLALDASCTFDTPTPPDANIIFVISDSATGPGAPMVVHEVSNTN